MRAGLTRLRIHSIPRSKTK